jgi:hypothetical protein
MSEKNTIGISDAVSVTPIGPLVRDGSGWYRH